MQRSKITPSFHFWHFRSIKNVCKNYFLKTSTFFKIQIWWHLLGYLRFQSMTLSRFRRAFWHFVSNLRHLSRGALDREAWKPPSPTPEAIVTSKNRTSIEFQTLDVPTQCYFCKMPHTPRLQLKFVNSFVQVSGIELFLACLR